MKYSNNTRVGQVVLRRGGVSGHAICPVESREPGGWSIAGVIRVPLSDVGLFYYPESPTWHRRAIGRVVRRVQQALAGEVAA